MFPRAASHMIGRVTNLELSYGDELRRHLSQLAKQSRSVGVTFANGEQRSYHVEFPTRSRDSPTYNAFPLFLDGIAAG